MSHAHLARCRLAAATLFVLPVVGLPALADGAVAAQPATSTSKIYTVDPHVPRGSGKPCVVELFHDALLDYQPDYSYAPPPGCPGPWAKVVLQLEFSGASHDSMVNWIDVELADIPIFVGTDPKYPHLTNWSAERDLTDYSSILMRPGAGQVILGFGELGGVLEPSEITGSARLLFYRPSAATPAPAVPDVVYTTNGPVTLPHNIERAYLDVTDRDSRLWFTCVPDGTRQRFPALFSEIALGDDPKTGIWPPAQGCGGGSFHEVEVRVDGVPAGMAPLFPRLQPDINVSVPNSVNLPAPPPQELNFMPYRVDLTPFAALLNDAGPHSITLEDSQGGFMAAMGQLLVYLDHGRALVTGGVTENTLATGASAPRVTNTLRASGDTLHGKIVTDSNRNFEIHGFVNTSHGLVRSVVKQSDSFSNAQVFDLDGLTWPNIRSYQQNIWLDSKVTRLSRRTVGAKVLSEDSERYCYPLQLRYQTKGEAVDTGEGWFVALTHAGIIANQTRSAWGTHYRPATKPYVTELHDVFSGNGYRSSREYTFDDNRGSCYQAALTTRGGALDASVTGVGCPKEKNTVRWFAHPDGSPDSLGWLH